MDLRKVKKLIELLEDSALVEMEITEGENTIRLSRAGTMATAAQIASAPVSAPVAAIPIVSEPTSSGPVVENDANDNHVESPMVGTYYAGPSPDADPFVQLGTKVKVGDTVCIIEAMKTFNSIEAEVAGTVVAVHKSPGDPVEFGEALFTVR